MDWTRHFAMSVIICPVCRSHKRVFLFPVKIYHQNCWPFWGSTVCLRF